MMDKNDEDRIKEKVRFFYHEKCRVHITRFDKSFWRGLITSEKSGGVWNFHEDKLGECLLFISDIHDINLFREEVR